MRTLFLTVFIGVICSKSAAACSITQAGFAAGDYQNGANNTGFSAGSVSVSGCAPNANVTLGLDAGLHSTTANPRLAQSGANTLQYTLRRANALGQVIGDGTAGFSWPLTTDATGAVSFAIYLTAPGSQMPAVGNYTDTVGETITF